MPGEEFTPGHRALDDAALLRPTGFTPPRRFTSTYVANLDNLHMGFVAFSGLLARAPHGALVAINSNFDHAAQPGYERHLKRPKPRPPVASRLHGRPRRPQGDGTCFNSSVEPVIAVAHPGVRPGKLYFLKCFPTTGHVQIPGGLCYDHSDSRAVLRAFVDHINGLGAGDPAAGGPQPVTVRDAVVHLTEVSGPAPRTITIRDEGHNMINHNFRLVRSSPRVVVDLARLAGLLDEAARLGALGLPPDAVPPPCVVREVKPPITDGKLSFRCVFHDCRPRVNVFLEGKVNVLGTRSDETARAIHGYFAALFAAHWKALVRLRPRPDSERCPSRLRAPPRGPKAAPEPVLDPAPHPAYGPEIEEAIAALLDVALGAPDDEKEEPPLTARHVP